MSSTYKDKICGQIVIGGRTPDCAMSADFAGVHVFYNRKSGEEKLKLPGPDLLLGAVSYSC